MKKKIYSLLLMLVCIFALSACGEEVRVEKSTAEIAFAPEDVFYYVTQPEMLLGEPLTEEMVAEAEHQYRQVADVRSPQMLAVLAGWRSYQASIDSIGNPQRDESQPMYFVEGKDGGVIAVFHIKGEKHPATIEIAYNSFDELQSVTVSVQLTLQEAMQRAATNTMIGMGTVFVMLIVIMIIISLLKIVPTLQEAFAKKEEAPAEAVDKAIENIIEREAAEEETDDNELIAVIAAAIAAAEATAAGSAEISTEGFVVRSIRRIK